MMKNLRHLFLIVQLLNFNCCSNKLKILQFFYLKQNQFLIFLPIKYPCLKTLQFIWILLLSILWLSLLETLFLNLLDSMHFYPRELSFYLHKFYNDQVKFELLNHQCSCFSNSIILNDYQYRLKLINNLYFIIN